MDHAINYGILYYRKRGNIGVTLKFGDLAIGAEIAKLNDFSRYRNTLGLRIGKKIAKFKTANIFVGGSTAKIAKLNARQYFHKVSYHAWQKESYL